MEANAIAESYCAAPIGEVRTGVLELDNAGLHDLVDFFHQPPSAFHNGLHLSSVVRDGNLLTIMRANEIGIETERTEMIFSEEEAAASFEALLMEGGGLCPALPR